MKIDRETSTPKYQQLKQILIRYLDENQYQAGQKIPSEFELMERFNVSRGTVRQTLGELVSEGVIYRQRGRGSFYAGEHVDSRPRSRLIGVVMPSMSSYIYPTIIQGINDVAQSKHYHVVLGGSYTNPDKEQACVKALIEQNIDGLLLEPSGGVPDYQNSPNFEYLTSLPFPIVFMDWAFDVPDLAYVSSNDIEGGFRATSYLIKAGHKKIACLHPDDHQPGIARYEGYRNALDRYGLEFDGRFNKSDTLLEWSKKDRPYTLMKELLALENERPSAVFFFNDYAALRGYAAIRDSGLRIPDDISVIGYDNSDLASLAEVPLTTVAHPKKQIGRWAAEILFDQLEHGQSEIPRQVLFNPDIVERESVKNLF